MISSPRLWRLYNLQIRGKSSGSPQHRVDERSDRETKPYCARQNKGQHQNKTTLDRRVDETVNCQNAAKHAHPDRLDAAHSSTAARTAYALVDHLEVGCHLGFGSQALLVLED